MNVSRDRDTTATHAGCWQVCCADGSALHEGPIGILGVTLSLFSSAFWLWMLKLIWRA